MSESDRKALEELLKFAEGLWAELKQAGYCEESSPEPWQFTKARAAIRKE